MRKIFLFSGMILIFILNFFFESKSVIDLKYLNIISIIIFLFLLYNIWKSSAIVYGFKNNFNKLILISIIFLIITPYSLIISYPLLMWKSKYYSIENIYSQSIAFSLPFIGQESFFYFEGGPKFFVLLNAIFLYSAGFEKLNSKLWLSGKAVEKFFSLPYLIKPFAFPKIKILSKVGNIIIVLELFLIFTLFSQNLSFIFFMGLILFGVSLFTFLDISYI